MEPVINPAAPIPAPVATPPAPVPAPVSVPAATPPAPVPASAPIFAEGGSTGGFFDGINWMEICFMAFAVATLSYSIYYHRMKIKFHNSELVDIKNRMDKQDAMIDTIKKTSTQKVGVNGTIRKSVRRFS